MHVVHFEQNPSIAATKKGLCDLTGLTLIFDEEFDTALAVQHPTHLGARVELDWIDKENRRCIRAWSETPNWNYIEVSALYLLKQLGGIPEKEYPFPV